MPLRAPNNEQGVCACTQCARMCGACTCACVCVHACIKLCHAPSSLYAHRISVCGYPSRCLCIVDDAHGLLGRGIQEIAENSLTQIQLINYAAGVCAIVAGTVMAISSVVTKAESITWCRDGSPFWVCLSSLILSLLGGIATIVLASISIVLSQVGLFGVLVRRDG